MKQREIKPCVFCAKGVMHDHAVQCVRVRFTHLGANLSAIRRQAGLEMMFRSGVPAEAMGPDEDLLKPIAEERDVLICQSCAIERRIFDLLELPAFRAETGSVQA